MHALADLILPELPTKLEHRVIDEVRQRTLTRCRRLGVIREDRMSARKYSAGRFALLSALAYPDANIDELELCNDFITYLFFVDDQAEEDETYGKRPEWLRGYFEGHIRALRDGENVATEDVGGRLLLEIRQRLLGLASQAWLERFSQDVSDYLLRGTLEGARCWTAGTVPSIEQYLEQRAWDSAVNCTQDLLEVAGAGELSEGVVGLAEWTELRRRCTNVVAFTNDLVSYPKEVRRHSSPNNLVHVIATHEGRTVEEAIERVIEIVNREVAGFEQVAARLPTHGTELDARVWSYVAGQRAWMIGNLLWSLATGRYVDPESPFAELRDQASVYLPMHHSSITV